MGRKAVRSLAGALGSLVVALVGPRSAGAFEINGGVSIGGTLVGTDPRLAVSPHAGLAWRAQNGFLLAAHDVFSILPATNAGGVGVYNQTSIALGYAGENASFDVGPSLSIFSMPACGPEWCARVAGVAPGAHAVVSVYFAGPFGISVNGNVDWLEARSPVFPGGVVAMVLAGPVVRWSKGD